MNKFIYTRETGFKNTPYNHGCYINGIDYDIVIRGIMFKDIRIIYLRINDFSVYQDKLQAKKAEYQFDNNLKACESYLRKNFKDFKLYDSYTINKLPYKLQDEILNT